MKLSRRVFFKAAILPVAAATGGGAFAYWDARNPNGIAVYARADFLKTKQTELDKERGPTAPRLKSQQLDTIARDTSAKNAWINTGIGAAAGLAVGILAVMLQAKPRQI